MLMSDCNGSAAVDDLTKRKRWWWQAPVYPPNNMRQMAQLIFVAEGWIDRTILFEYGGGEEYFNLFLFVQHQTSSASRGGK